MQVANILAQMGGVSAIARQLGLDEGQAQRGAEALLPALLGGVKKQVQTQSGGMEGIGGLLAQLGGSALLGRAFGQPEEGTEAGEGVLGQIFGSREVSRTVAENAAQTSGLSVETLKKMLPMLATMIAGFLAQRRAADDADSSESSGFGSMLGGLLGGSNPAANSGDSGLSSIMSMMDLDGDGNPLDDIMRLMGKGGR